MARTREIVVDASVVLAVILNEPEKDAIVEMTRGRNLLAPGCLHWEVGNAFSAMLKRKRIGSGAVMEALATFAVIPIKEVQVDIEEALELCASRNIYAYDAYYLVAARKASRPILTLDGRMVAVAELEGIKQEEI